MIAAPTIAPTDEVLGLPQAAELLDCHRATIEKRILKGQLPAREIAGRLFVRRVDLEAYRTATGGRRADTISPGSDVRPSSVPRAQ